MKHNIILAKTSRRLVTFKCCINLVGWWLAMINRVLTWVLESYKHNSNIRNYISASMFPYICTILLHYIRLVAPPQI